MSKAATLEHASLVRPCAGEQVSGDATVVQPMDKGLFIAIVDVLGHGPDAHDVAVTISSYLAEHGGPDTPAVMRALHEHIKGTRGAAIGVCAIDPERGRVSYAGTGNTVLRRFGRTDTRLVSYDGVVGQNMRTPRVQELDLEAGDLLMLYTDGVQDRFKAEDYPGIDAHAPEQVVRIVLERFGKPYDDAACIAVRYQP